RQLGGRAAARAGPRGAATELSPEQRLARAPLRVQGQARTRARVGTRRARGSERRRSARLERLERAGVRRAGVHRPRRVAALGRLSSGHPHRPGGGGPLGLTRDGRSHSEPTADVALSEVSMRVARGMPVLDLEYLRGRLGATQRAAKGFEVSGRKVMLRTDPGIEVPPADFRVSWQIAEGEQPFRGEIEADAIELAPLAT